MERYTLIHRDIDEIIKHTFDHFHKVIKMSLFHVRHKNEQYKKEILENPHYYQEHIDDTQGIIMWRPKKVN